MRPIEYFVGALLLLTAPAAWSEEVPTRAIEALILAAYEPDAPASALDELASLARAGHVDAALALGRLSMTDAPTRGADPQRAERWLTVVATQGEAAGMWFLSQLYSDPSEPYRPEEALEWLESAAHAGHPEAAFALHRLHAGRTEYKALAWLEQAADRGHAEAQYHVGLRYAHGYQVDQDLENAYFWLTLAAMQGHERAAERRLRVGRGLDADTLAILREEVELWVAD